MKQYQEQYNQITVHFGGGEEEGKKARWRERDLGEGSEQLCDTGK